LHDPSQTGASAIQVPKTQSTFHPHHETLSVVAMRVCNEDCPTARIHRCDAAPTPTSLAEIVSDDFPVLLIEKALLLTVAALVAGLLLLLAAVCVWKSKGFGPLDYRQTMRLVIPGSLITALGFQTILASFFMSILGLSRK
jgi:hypothetical protein